MSRERNGGKPVGLVIVCLCLITPLTVVGTPPLFKAATVIQDPIVFHNTPENGVYWNDHKIANYSVPLYLHYRFKREISIGISITGNITGDIWFRLDGGTWQPYTGGGCPWLVRPVAVPVFGHSRTLGVKVVFQDGQSIYDNLTVYRLFP